MAPALQWHYSLYSFGNLIRLMGVYDPSTQKNIFNLKKNQNIGSICTKSQNITPINYHQIKLTTHLALT
jgi:hypothetical protein